MNKFGQTYVALRDQVRKLTGTLPTSPYDSFPARPPHDQWRDPRTDLARLLDFAKQHVPYYQRIADQLSTDRLEDWPILTKDILRNEFEQLRSDDWETRDVIHNASGGSTGRPVQFIHERSFRERRKATNEFYDRELLGVDQNTSRVILWNSPRDVAANGDTAPQSRRPLKNEALRLMGIKTTTLHAYHMSRDDMDSYLATINREKPEYILAYAGSLYQLASRAHGQKLEMHKPRRMTTTAETLQPFMRERITEVFGPGLSDCYGSREVGLIGGEAKEGTMLLFDFFNHVEVVDAQGKQVGPGGEGRILVTCLFNYAMPLIRYEIGDMAIVGQPVEMFGKTWPTLERVVGRVAEQFVKRDGGLVHGLFFVSRFRDCNWVDELQVVQHGVDSIEINFVPLCEPPAEDQARLEREFREAMGGECEIRWTRLAEIPRTKEGKLLYTRCLVKPEATVQRRTA